MISQSSKDTPNIIHDIQDINAQKYVHIFAFAFLLYDHALTFDEEVHLIWSGPRIRGSYWFLFLRYVNTLGNIAEMAASWVNLTAEGCRIYNTSRQIFLIVIHLSIVAVLTLRIYAFYMRSKRILYSLIAIGAILLGIAVWCLTEQSLDVESPVEGCNVGIAWQTSPRLAVPWEAILIYDTIIVILTLLRSHRLRRRNDITRTSSPIISVVVRDGALYFIIIAMALLANVLTFYTTGPFFRGGLSVFASNLSVVLICRLILHFRASFNEDAMTNTVITSITATRFTTIPITDLDGLQTVATHQDIELHPLQHNGR